MQKLLDHRTRWILVGVVFFLVLVFLHPLFLEAFGKEHPDNCPICAHFSTEFAILASFCAAHFLVIIGYFLAIPSAKLFSRFLLVFSGRAPPALS